MWRPARVRSPTMDVARNREKRKEGYAGKHIRKYRAIECANPSLCHQENL
jgi:hypothetical protein